MYYFQPSTTPSSPPPMQSSDFLGSGSWYGEHAAKAWASIADWVIDRHVHSTDAIIGNSNQRVYISAVHVMRSTDSNFQKYGREFLQAESCRRFSRPKIPGKLTALCMSGGRRLICKSLISLSKLKGRLPKGLPGR